MLLHTDWKHQTFLLVCSERVHCANAVRTGSSSNSSFSTKSCAWAFVAYLTGVVSLSEDSTFFVHENALFRLRIVLSRKTTDYNTEPEVPVTSQPLHQNRYLLTINFSCHFELYVVGTSEIFLIVTASLSTQRPFSREVSLKIGNNNYLIDFKWDLRLLTFDVNKALPSGKWNRMLTVL
jgi:hypothetical protein